MKAKKIRLKLAKKKLLVYPKLKVSQISLRLNYYKTVNFVYCNLLRFKHLNMKQLFVKAMNFV